MIGFGDWLKQATRLLAEDSAAQVRTEIQEHYESARAAALSAGATTEEAEASALKALGDAKTVNRQYRRVLLTSAEAKMLREGNWEARAFCALPWLRRLVLAMPVALIAAVVLLFLKGEGAAARDALIVGMGVSPLVAALVFPIYTPSRSRIFRYVKWITITVALAMLFGPRTLEWSWLLLSCLWPLAWTEWMRASIRRKLPVARWPKQLYL